MDLNKLNVLGAINRVGGEYAPSKKAAQLCDARIVNPSILCGVEIELEGWRATQAQMDKFGDYWDEHEEGSLRDGREFVLYPPRNGSELTAGLDKFFNSGARWVPSERASVHIHLDMAQYTVGQFRSMFALIYALEGAIYRVADENRKWASYSCPLIDMRPARMYGILVANTRDKFRASVAGRYHEEKYYGFNAVSLNKHGTVEFRYFPCTTDGDLVYKWINLCMELHTAGTIFDDPLSLIERINALGVEDFVKKYLPRSADSLLMYMDRNETIRRLTTVVAMVKDAQQVGVRVVGDLAEVQSEAFTNMLQNVLGEVYDNRAKKKNEAVEVRAIDLYNNLLKQADVEVVPWKLNELNPFD